MICIFSYPSELSIASRRINLNHTGGLLRREVMETITLFNTGKSPLSEIALEMEEFRSGLSIIDEEGNLIPFLTKEDIRNRLAEGIKAKLDTGLWDISSPTHSQASGCAEVPCRILRSLYDLFFSGISCALSISCLRRILPRSCFF